MTYYIHFQAHKGSLPPGSEWASDWSGSVEFDRVVDDDSELCSLVAEHYGLNENAIHIVQWAQLQ